MNYQQLLALFKETHLELQQRAARSVDTSLVIRNWLFGWYIVEFEQGGSDRAEYGANLLKKIAAQLKLKGCSERSLALCCKFYLTYSGILQRVSAKSESRQNEFQKIGPTVPDQSFREQSGLPEIQQTLVEVTLPRDSNIFASKYQLYLPSKDELKRQLEEAAGITGHCDNPDQEGMNDVR